jgi:di/tricarboxylate transporter
MEMLADFGYELRAEAGFAISVMLLALVFAGFLFEKLPPAAVATAGGAGFLMLGFVTTDEVLAVFSNPAPITIAAMFILSGALVSTGVLGRASDWFVQQAERRGIIALVLLMICAAFASGLMNNTPLVIVLIPVLVRMAQTLGLSATRVLIPLSYMAILGGTLTLVGTSTNLLVAGIAADKGLEPLGMLEILPYGLVALATGSLVLLGVARFVLPDRGAGEGTPDDEQVQYLTEVRFVNWVNKRDDGGEGEAPVTRALSSFTSLKSVHVQSVIRAGVSLKPQPDMQIERTDRLVVKTTQAEILTLRQHPNYRVGQIKAGSPILPTADRIVVDAVVAMERSGVRRKLSELDWLAAGGVRILGVSRHMHNPGRDLSDVRLRAADRVLIEGPGDAVNHALSTGDLVAASEPRSRPFRRHRAPVALTVMAGVIALSVLNVAPIVTLALIGVAIVLVLHCIEADDAWRSVDGSILVLIFAMLAIGKGLENAGFVDVIVNFLTPFLAEAPPLVLLLSIYALTSVLTELASNNAVAVIIAPVVISLAQSLGVEPRPLIYAVMIGASASFSTPIGYQTNTLVYAAGNYKFTDFLKAGPLMNISVGIAACVAIWAWADF